MLQPCVFTVIQCEQMQIKKCIQSFRLDVLVKQPLSFLADNIQVLAQISAYTVTGLTSSPIIKSGLFSNTDP